MVIFFFFFLIKSFFYITNYLKIFLLISELAINYKEDGNFNFKYKKYRLAILSYTEGLKTQCKDDNIRAQLYNNRAAAHYMLKNYR